MIYRSFSTKMVENVEKWPKNLEKNQNLKFAIFRPKIIFIQFPFINDDYIS